MLGQYGETNWLCIFFPKQERESKYHTMIQCVAFYHIGVFIPRIVNFVQPLTQYDQQMDKCTPLHIGAMQRLVNRRNRQLQPTQAPNTIIKGDPLQWRLIQHVIKLQWLKLKSRDVKTIIIVYIVVSHGTW